MEQKRREEGEERGGGREMDSLCGQTERMAEREGGRACDEARMTKMGKGAVSYFRIVNLFFGSSFCFVIYRLGFFLQSLLHSWKIQTSLFK